MPAPLSLRGLVIALVLAAGSAVGQGPDRTARQPIRVFDERDGVPSTPFESLAVDAKGYLWCGTQDGILRYNGHRWTRIPLPAPNRSLWISRILPAEDGSIWVGTNGNGLHRWREGVWTSFTVHSGFPAQWIPALAETRNVRGESTLWVGTGQEGLWKFAGGRLERVPDPGGRPHGLVAALLASRDGGLWAGTAEGLFHLDKGVWSCPGPRLGQVNCLVESGTALWAGTNRGLARLQDGRWTREQGLPSPFITSLSVQHDADGGPVIWAGTDRGMGVLRQGRWTVLDTRSGMPSNGIRSSLVLEMPGSSPQIWIGTFSGLARLVPGGWHSLPPECGFADTAVFAIHEDPHKGFWFGTSGRGIFHFSKGAWSMVDSVAGHTLSTVFAFSADPGGSPRETLYAGTRDSGVVVFENGRWRRWEHNAELPQPSAYAVLATRERGAPVLWVGTRNGLLRAGPGGTRVFGKGAGLGHDHVTALAETKDAEGVPVIWAGTRGGGISRYRRGAWATFGEAQGLPEGRIASLTVIRDAQGKAYLWAGTQASDAVRIDPDHPELPWTFLPEADRDRLPSRSVQQIQSDALGRIYLFTLGGVTRLTPLADGRFDLYTFTAGDGLPSSTCTMGSGRVDSAGRVWTGTVSGAAFFDPAREIRESRPKNLYFERCQELGSGGSLGPGAVLSHRRNHLLFEYSLLSFYRESDTAYRIQLEGLDPAPGPWTPEPSKEYSAVPEGTYVFKVWARDHAGTISGPITLPFRIRPAFWRHPAAYLVYGALILAAAWAFSRYRVRLLRTRNLNLQSEIRKATSALLEREAQMEIQASRLSEVNNELRVLNDQKTRFLGIAAHDLRNPLTGIVLTAEKIREDDDHGQVRQDLARIIDQARAMTELIDRFLNITAIESGQVKAALESADLFELAKGRVSGFATRAEAKNLTLTLEGSAPGPGVRCDIRYTHQILDNLISNAIKFSPAGRRIVVRVEDAGATGRVSVRDQGPGISEADRRKIFGWFTRLSATPTGTETSTGLGLSIVKSMVDAMDGTLRVESSLGEGSTFILDLPKRG